MVWDTIFPSPASFRGKVFDQGIPSSSWNVHEGAIEGVAIHQFRQQGHALQVAVVDPHSPRREHQRRAIRDAAGQVADETVESLIDITNGLRCERGGRMIVERVMRINSVPETFDGRVNLADTDIEQVAVLSLPLEQPHRDSAPKIQCLSESSPHLPAVFRRIGGTRIHPVMGSVGPEQPGDLVENAGFIGHSRGAGVVAAPSHNSPDTGGHIQINIGDIEDDRSDGHAFELRLLQCSDLRGGIVVPVEIDSGPSIACAGR